MTAQPDTRQDLEVVEALDFDPELPCEAYAPTHAAHGTGPAVWLIDVHCCTGAYHEDQGRMTSCDGCLKACVGEAWLRCTVCGASGPPSDFVTVLGPVKSGA